MLAAATVIMTGLVFAPPKGYEEPLTPQYILVFGLGMFASLQGFGDQHSRFPRLSSRMFRIALAIAAAAWLFMVFRGGQNHLRYEDLLMGVISASVLVLATRGERSTWRRIGALPFFVWVGGFSYTLYLIHFPLQQLFWQTFTEPTGLSSLGGFLIVAFLGTASIIGVSFAFYRVFEKPFMRSRPRA